MTSEQIEQRFRLFLLLLAAFLCFGTVAELWLTEHTGSAVQLIPFVLCGLGFVVVLLALLKPTATVLRTLRWVMVVAFLGSLFGVFEHIEHNLEFALEIRPNAVAGDLIFEAFGGANPLLAPGILGVAALLALAATYYHPLLGKR